MNHQTKLTNEQILEQPCNSGDRKCIGDRWHVCEDGRWKPSGGYCPDDSSQNGNCK
ncbi:hypothetical protein [Virgibacillus proomii]|uniref:hypothetical protein n=1 Tax=Virgibacillus proomii TaxID=84407 RepID=UPI0015C37217|nr:hypothetical protein [Virgibacillus proomii]